MTAKMYAGPLPLSPVTASIWDSLTMAAIPTAVKMASAVARSSGLASGKERGPLPFLDKGRSVRMAEPCGWALEKRLDVIQGTRHKWKSGGVRFY